MKSDTSLLHIALNSDVTQFLESGRYRCSSLDTEGFIHCCLRHQLSGVVNRYYSDVEEVQLMSLDPEKLDAAVVSENTLGGDELFPHIYGSINKEAVQSITPFGLQSEERLTLTRT